MVVYVADINLARYFVDVDLGLLGDLQESCESDALQQPEKENLKHVATIAEKAGKDGTEVKTHVEIGSA